MLRLILALVLALVSVPMPAAACEGAMPASHAMAGMQHAPDRPVPVPMQHLCLGCTPMADWDAARIVPPLALPAPLPVVRIATLPLLPGEAPLPPPPRSA